MTASGFSGSNSPIVFDPTSREYQVDPYPILGLIREAEPLHRSNMGWLMTRYEHAAAILRDWRTWIKTETDTFALPSSVRQPAQ